MSTNNNAGRYTKRPVTIDAWRIDIDALRPGWVQTALATGAIDWDPSGEGLYIETLEGVMHARNGDWLISGVAGELFTCKPDIFAVTYEPDDLCANCGEDKSQHNGLRCVNGKERSYFAAAPKAAPAQPAQHPDDAAVDALAMLMKAKLAKQRAKGYGGWDSAECKQEWLSALLREHVIKGDPVDVANFCAFLSARGEVIAPSPAEALREAEMLFAKAPQPAVQQGDAEQREVDARHAAIYRWMLSHIADVLNIFDNWSADEEAGTDELHDVLAARAAKEWSQP